MKYINKEYGIKFRPPFAEFSEIKETGPDSSHIKFPSSYKVGIGYDYSAINGAMLVGKHGSLWGVKVSYYNGKKWLDNDDFIKNMGQDCVNTIGAYAHFSSGPLSIKWIKYGEQSVLLQVSARKKLKVRIVCYPCYGWHGELSIEGKVVNGRSPFVGIIPGEISFGETSVAYKERYRVLMDDSDDREYFIAQSYNEPQDSANGAFNEAIMEFVINKNQQQVYLYACVGDQNILDQAPPRLDKLITQFDTHELRYGVDKTMGSGVLGSPCELARNSVQWSRIYYPYLLTEIYSSKRSMLNTHFGMDGLDENCIAMLGCMSGGVDTATSQLKYTLSDRVLSVLAVWHSFMQKKDKRDILPLYNKLVEQYSPQAELVATTNEDKLEVAYKWTDTPMREKNDKQIMYSLDLSCLKLFAFDVLERMAHLFDLPQKEQYTQSRQEMIVFINKNLWNEKEGLYCNRYVDGRWAVPNNSGATSFYPLLCGAVDTQDKLSALVNNLISPKKFWTTYPVSTLNVSNGQFGKKGMPDNNGNCNAAYLEFRGSIVPYVNYIIYHGLVRYGLDEIAAKLAHSSAKLWANNRSSNVENYSLYLPKGKRVKSREYLSTNGNMLALIGQQELIDIEYFRQDLVTNSIRFGTFADGEHSLSNLNIWDNLYSIEVKDSVTTVLCNNNEFFVGDGGRFVVRNFCQTDVGCEFMIDAHANININISLLDKLQKSYTKYFVIVPVGKSKVKAENEMVNLQRIGNS